MSKRKYHGLYEILGNTLYERTPGSTVLKMIGHDNKSDGEKEMSEMERAGGTESSLLEMPPEREDSEEDKAEKTDVIFL